MSGLLNSLKNLAGSSKQSTGEGDMRFSVSPKGGACGWAEWLKAMRLVARLPTGIPPEFRKKLWLTLAEQHLKVNGVDWARAERTCFSEWTNPDDTELGVQIVKDLHRTGCSLFCGSEGRENQAVLKRVLLAYARWNKAVGYCQGFNMLAALILEVMDRSESDSLKVMIYLIEAVLPEGYFANNLRGLSVDMAVFRDLLKLRLPRLSAHLEKLQKGAAEGSCYEPPLTNVFTMQWFLTLFCNCLPRNTVLRVWDLVFLEGDEILLTTALAIWDTLQDRILIVESADEFYSVMGELARQTLEAPPATSEALLVRAAQLGPVPELPRLRDKHRYNITPWAHSVQSAAKKGLRMFYSEDETDSSDDGDKLAITTAYGFQAGGRGRGALVAAGVFGHPDREKLALDISALKQQYARLRERQRQAHIILAAACARQPSVGATSGHGPISVNHLLLGKSAIVSARGRRLGPPQGAIPPSRSQKTNKSSSKAQSTTQTKSETLHWKDENQKKTVQRRDSVKWRDIKQMPMQGDEVEVDEEPEEDGKLVSESEINEILQTSMRSRRKSESSSYSECSESSTSTSLCDEPNRMSDFDSELSDNFTGNTDDVFKDVDNDKTSVENIDKDGSDKLESVEDNDSNNEFGSYVQEFEELLDRTNNIEIEDDRLCAKQTTDDTTNNEFGSYVQEFEELLDRTNNIENEDNRLCGKHTTDDTANNEFGCYMQEFEELLDRTKYIESKEVCSKTTHDDESKINKFENYVKGFEVLLDNKDQIEDNQPSIKDESPDDKENSEFVNYMQELDSSKIDSDDDQPSIKSSEKKDPLTDDIKFQNTDSDFNEFVDSNRGKPLRNYLDEFRKADDAIKNERSWEEEESLQNEFMEKTSDITEDDCSIKLDKNSEIDDEKDQGKEQNYWDHSDKTDIKPFVYPDFRSNSCERSVSSSVSSISPILRYAAECAEGSPSFSCYKSPMRAESHVANEFVEDEKPLVLTIDKYFEHSPEFFGARKSGAYVSSDEDDDGFMSKTKIINLDDIKKCSSDLEEIYKNNGDDQIEVSLEDNSFKIIEEVKEIVASSNPYSLNENLSFYEASSSTEKKSSPISPEELKNVLPKLPFEKNTEHIKYNVLEKTKSEELPQDQKRAFSLLDEEIEAIRSQSGRRNSERALRIIQENSKILHRILVNQVNKTNSKDYLQEETSESLADEMNQRERRDLRFHDYKYAKTLPSPRSASLDESLQRKNKEFTYVPGLLSFDLDNRTSVKSKETTPIATDKKFIDSTKQIVTPTSSGTLTPLLDKNKSDDQNVVRTDENKTDMFGWENKGFSANQHIKSYYKHEYPTTKTYSHDIITSYIDKSKTLYEYESKKITEFKTPDSEKKYQFKVSPKDEVELHLNPVSYSMPKSQSKEKNLSFSSIVEPTEYSSKDFSESWKIENNNSLNDSYNVSSYKYSDNIDVISKPLHKFTDSALSRVNDTFSWAPETSPLDNNVKPDASKYETSQSSDLCVVSSSMSFSFDPSVEDHPSSKPPTFNSSDTLCQLTSLDQVSTPISPKVTAFTLPKDTTGISQKELSMELDKFRLPSEESSIIQGSLTDTESGCISSLKTPTSPLSYQDKSHSLKSPDKTFNPFPVKSSYRQPKELGMRLGLYKDPLKSPSK